MQHTDLTQGDEKPHLINQTVPMIWGLLAIVSMALEACSRYFPASLRQSLLQNLGKRRVQPWWIIS